MNLALDVTLGGYKFGFAGGCQVERMPECAIPAGYTEVGRDVKRRGKGVVVVVKAESPGSMANWKKSWLRILVSENKTQLPNV